MKLKITLTEFINQFVERAQYFIAEFEKFKELKGEQRKERVDSLMLHWTLQAIDNLPVNMFFKFCLKNVMKLCLPALTQAAFNLIEAKIEGITK